MIHYMLLPGYLPATCHKNNAVTLLVTSMLYYRNITCLLGRARNVRFSTHVWRTQSNKIQKASTVAYEHIQQENTNSECACALCTGK